MSEENTLYALAFDKSFSEEIRLRAQRITDALEAGEMEKVSVVGGDVLVIHHRDKCSGLCPVHHPSDHHMLDWPLNWRSDRGIFERICEHGVGHPDPDSMSYVDPDGSRMEGVHGCDGCCARNKAEAGPQSQAAAFEGGLGGPEGK